MHVEAGLAHDREHTAWLDAARDMDRLSGTVVQIDRRADRDELVGCMTVRRR